MLVRTEVSLNFDFSGNDKNKELCADFIAENVHFMFNISYNALIIPKA